MLVVWVVENGWEEVKVVLRMNGESGREEERMRGFIRVKERSIFLWLWEVE